MAFKYTTECCALSQIKACNNDRITSIRAIINKAKREHKTNKEWSFGNAERAFFCIVAPEETTLEKKLIIIGFKKIASFGRRHPAPQDTQVKMYLYHY